MKILQISTNWGHGGPGGVVKDIHNYLNAAGHEPVVAFGRYDVPEGVPSIKIGSSLDTYYHVLTTRLFDAAGFSSVKATKRLICEIDKIDPDIIHLHNLIGYYLNVEILFGYIKEKNFPVVWTLHDCWAFTGHCINFERKNCEKWKTACHKCPLKDNYPEVVLFDRSLSNYQRKKRAFTEVSNMELVTPSKWLADLVSESYLKPYPCHVINNGIDLNVFRPIESNIREQYALQGKKILLCVASVWNEMKGEHIVYELAEKLDDSYAIVMIGRKSAKHVPDRIIDLPRTQNIEELVKWYTVADIFVNPTLGDNFPTVNIEALACGTPIVTNNTGGSPEIAGNEFGRIVYSKTADEFVEKIQECLVAQYSPEDCRNASMKFARDRCFEKYMAVYRSVLNATEES